MQFRESWDCLSYFIAERGFYYKRMISDKIVEAMIDQYGGKLKKKNLAWRVWESMKYLVTPEYPE